MCCSFRLSSSCMHSHTLAIVCLSACVLLSLLTVRCVNTSYASSKAFRLAEVQPNYVEYYLEDTVTTVRPSVTWLR